MASIDILQEENYAIIRLNRPEKLNAFDRGMSLSLQQALDQCRNDDGIRAIMLTGEGKAFSAGQDLGEVIKKDGPGMEKILSEHYNPIIQRIRDLEKPVVAAVNGVAAGAGANIALSCDIVVASESASFIQAFSKIGLIPDSGGTYFLPRLIGFQKASALMMLGDKISASEAERLGMIYRMFPDASFITEARRIIKQLSEMPTRGLALTKIALNASLNHRLEEQLALEDQLQQQAVRTLDFDEGVNAFLEKRKPLFIGK